MADALVRLYFPHTKLNASVAVATLAAREARDLHQLHAASADVLGQALCGAALLASLQKDESRLNLQVECDGALRGLFVDATAGGALRGYVKNVWLDVEGASGPFRYRPLFGNAGYVSVLRDFGAGGTYRSSVELKDFDLAVDLTTYLNTSDQVGSALALEVLPEGTELLGHVTGAVVQLMPGAEAQALAEVTAGLRERLSKASATEGGAAALAQALFAGMGADVVATHPLEYRCTCSKERVLAMLAGFGRDDVQNMLDTQGKALVTCHFCGRKHEATEQDLRTLLKTFEKDN